MLTDIPQGLSRLQRSIPNHRSEHLFALGPIIVDDLRTENIEQRMLETSRS